VSIDDGGNYGRNGANIVINRNVTFIVGYVNVAPLISFPGFPLVVSMGRIVVEYGGEHITVLDDSGGNIGVLLDCYYCVLSLDSFSDINIDFVCASESLNLIKGLNQMCVTGLLEDVNFALTQLIYIPDPR
jgi:hypothetical protein